MAYVNLWELIVTVAGRDVPNQDKCKAIEEEARKGAFSGMQELSLEVTDFAWTVRFFSCEPGDEVEITIDRNENITVKRVREVVHGMIESREVRF